MKTEVRIWTGLGIATAVAGAGLSGCADDPGAGADSSDGIQASQSGEMGEGEGGESGEGGVDFASAASDPVIYGSALAVAEAHAIAAKDAFAVGRTDEAAEMFGHPVTEVLADMDPVFEQLGVSDIKPLFFEASSAVLDGGSEDEINQHFEGIVSALRAAEEKGPDNGTSEAMVAAGVSADQIDRAISMYRQAARDGIYPPYLDGYGFYKAAEVAFKGSEAEIKQADEGLHSRITEALALLAAAYPSADKKDELNADQGALTAAGSQVLLALPR